MTLESLSLRFTELLISFAIILQSVELLLIKSSFSNSGVWRWEIIRKEFEIFPKHILNFLDIQLKYPNFLILIYLRLILAGLMIFAPNASFTCLQLFFTFLILLRWRGTFNGGSDYMTLIILSGLSLASLFPENSPITSGCLWYICLQTCLSYFVSGSVKLRKANWRSGKALAAFIASSNYQLPMLIKQLFKNPFFLFISSWSVITMELCFPATLINPQVCLGLISAAFIFHIVNWYILGLNRFVFAWLAAYPAVYYCSSFLNR